MAEPPAINFLEVKVWSLINECGGAPDFRVEIGEFSWLVHSHRLVTVSSFFRKAIEGAVAESREHKLTLNDKDITPESVACFLMWCYTHEYTEDDYLLPSFKEIMSMGRRGYYESPPQFLKPKFLDAQMFMLADKFMAPVLEAKSMDRLASRLRGNPGLFIDLHGFISETSYRDDSRMLFVLATAASLHSTTCIDDPRFNEILANDSKLNAVFTPQILLKLKEMEVKNQGLEAEIKRLNTHGAGVKRSRQP